MASLEELGRALVNADKAGDVEAAKTLANEIQRQRAAETAPQPEEASKGMYRGTILPFEKNLDTGETNWAVPGLITGMVDSATAAFTAPYRAMTGELPMTDDSGRTSPDAIAESTNMALWASPGSIASATGQKIAANAGKSITDDAAKAAATDKNALLQSSERLGVQMPTAAASDSSMVQQAGKIVSNIPLVGMPLRKAAQSAIKQLDDAATKAQKELGAGNPAIAGNAAKENIADYAKNVLGEAVKAKYDAVDALITQNVTSPLAQTTRVATDIAARRSNAALPTSSAVSMIQQAISRDGGLNYQGIKTLRTRVGEMLENPSLIPSDISQAELKQIYGSLSDDLKAAVERAGGKKALEEFNAANSFAANVSKEREVLNKVLGTKSDEAIFDKIASMASSTSRADVSSLIKVKNAVSDDTWGEISSAVIARIGRDREGNLTPDRFIAEYGKLSKAGQATLFNTETRQALEDIARVSSRFKQLNQYANPSGTGQTVLGGALGTGAVLSPLTAIKVAVPGYITAKILARPATAKTAADYVKAYELAARMPSTKTQEFLNRRARELAVVAANDMGNPALANGLFTKLSSIQKNVAEEEGADQSGQPKARPEADPEQQRFNNAYLQGNGA
jgi:hypothetical protein